MIEIRATRQPAYEGDDIEIHIFDREFHSAAQPLAMKVVEKGHWIEPTCQISPETAQKLMNSLWECGLRPVAAAGSAGQLSATERHLEDMRTIAFGCLKDKVT